MRTGNYISKSTLQEVKDLLIQYLLHRYRTDKGTVLSLYPLKVIKFYGRRDLMCAPLLSYINYYLRELTKLGLATEEKRSRKGGKHTMFLIRKSDIPKAIEVIKRL